MSETTIPEATKDKIFAFLDILDAKGQPIPSIRVIAAEVHASASHVSPAQGGTEGPRNQYSLVSSS